MDIHKVANDLKTLQYTAWINDEDTMSINMLDGISQARTDLINILEKDANIELIEFANRFELSDSELEDMMTGNGTDRFQYTDGFNTFNWGYLLPDCEMNLFQDKGSKDYYMFVSVNIDNDVRGRYSDPVIFGSYSSAQDARDDIKELLMAQLKVEMYFKDGSSVVFGSDSFTDSPEYEIVLINGKGISGGVFIDDYKEDQVFPLLDTFQDKQLSSGNLLEGDKLIKDIINAYRLIGTRQFD